MVVGYLTLHDRTPPNRKGRSRRVSRFRDKDRLRGSRDHPCKGNSNNINSSGLKLFICNRLRRTCKPRHTVRCNCKARHTVRFICKARHTVRYNCKLRHMVKYICKVKFKPTVRSKSA